MHHENGKCISLLFFWMCRMPNSFTAFQIRQGVAAFIKHQLPTHHHMQIMWTYINT